MLGLHPIGPVESKKLGSFDFPTKVAAKACKPNVDPGGIHPHLEHWYGKMGSPPAEQGWPCIMERTPEAEDPEVAPWIDAVLDANKPALLYHTGRLSGDMIPELADEAHTSRVVVHAVPYKNGEAVFLGKREQTLEPQPQSENAWFWRDPNKPKELMYTLKLDVPAASDADNKLRTGEVYKLLVEWEFFHKTPGTDKLHSEPFSGFDDNITFKVGPETIV
jgi:hypothetical protein